MSPSKTNSLVARGQATAFALVTTLFFMWAVANNLNDILIRQFQKALELNRGQAGFIQLVFYLGYFSMALPAGLVMKRYGYKTGILIGLGLYAAGAILFYPAAEIRVYAAFLFALYVVASGLAFLETAANPFITILGDQETAAQRINLAQSFNGLGAATAPIIGGIFIFSGTEYTPAQIAELPSKALEAYRVSEAHAVQVPYLLLAGVVLLIAFAIYLTKLPEIVESKAPEVGGTEGVLRNKNLLLAVGAQFFYVGAQVGVWSYFIDFTKDVLPEVSEKTAAFYLSTSLIMFTVGRFVGSAAMKSIRPENLLTLFGIINIFLCAISAFGYGRWAVYALMATSFFMSIMFPTIFALGIRGLGEQAKNGSSFIIMAIVGGAIIPPIMGHLSDVTGHLQWSLLLPLLCFCCVAWYGKQSRALPCAVAGSSVVVT